MPSETIWSNSDPTSPHLSKYRSVLDLVDPDVAKMLASNAPIEGRRFSFHDSGEIESNLFDFKASLAQVSYAASTGGPHAPGMVPSKTPPFQLGTASISGGITSRHPPQDSFLHKFSSVADATRDIELSNTLGTLSLDGNTRRSSFNNDQGMKPFNVSPHGSMNENLNMPAPRNSRHQSISEKIDNYNSNSPIQASAALSISSDLNSNSGHQGAADVSAPAHGHPHGFWNPATAASFTPNQTFSYFLENPAFPFSGSPVPPNPYARQQPVMPPISPPPFMMGNPPFMDGGMYGFMGYPGQAEANMNPEGEALAETVETGESSALDSQTAGLKLPQKTGGLPGIGLMNRQMHPASGGFMFHPFNPYGVYPQGATPTSPPVPQTDIPEDSHGVAVPIPPVAFDASMMPPPAGNRSVNQSIPPNSGQGKKSKAGRGNGGGKGGHHIYRSPLLEEIRSNSKGKEYYLKDIYGHVVEFTKDQHGSRFIQQRLPSASDEEKEVVFNEIRDISYELMTDVFGNYVIQKFFEHGSTTQKVVLLECMKTNIYDLSLQMYGCRVVQRALESLPLEGQLQVVDELRDHILVSAKDQNGNHVIQKSIERIPFENIRFILDSLRNHIYHLSTHPYGCRVIQRLLEYSDIEDQKEIMGELNRFIFYLIQDQYGNYVIQHILERGNPEDREEVLKVALGSVVNFSKHKFASNVIEKCIKYGSTEQRRRILHEVMLENEDLEKETVDDDSPLALMMKDQYANYVIQKLVEGFDAKSSEKKSLVVKLRQYLKQLSMKNNYGKHLASVEKMIVVAETALVEADRV
ncbi:CIC11C00000000663 [Sungouiella intermedia]|uniref:Pumilio homology domain family member 3 n=1 Tax=Sungouiella intermedia TaxID=45354 RepID=A0A1L0BUT4_9ASCO|nr:CIC11C00000000663 [[Candida] intermedia]